MDYGKYDRKDITAVVDNLKPKDMLTPRGERPVSKDGPNIYDKLSKSNMKRRYDKASFSFKPDIEALKYQHRRRR